MSGRGIPARLSVGRDAMLAWRKGLKQPLADLILPGALLLLALWLRLHRLDQVEFLWDQAEISKWALRMARQGEIAWVGPPSSTGIYSFLGTVWLMAIPYALSPSPIIATGFVALLNVVAVLGCYLLARRWFGRWAALVATLLFTVAPWAVIYSRKIWQVELLIPFTLLYAATGWWAFVKGKGWAVPAHALALAWLIQIHLSALALVPLTGLWALLFWRRLAWRWVPPAILPAALLFTPYLLFDARHQWFSLRRFLEMARRPATLDAGALHAVWINTTGLDLHWLTGPDRYPEFVAATPNLRGLFVVEGGLAFGAALLALLQVARQARRGLDEETAAALMAATWLAMPILFYTRHVVPVAPHYFTTVFPAPYLLVGWLVRRVASWTRTRGRAYVFALGLLIGAIALAQLREITGLFRFVTTHDTLQGYDTPLGYDVRAARTALRLSRAMDDAEVILLSEGDEPRSYEMPATADVLLYGYPHRAVDIRTALVLPAGPAVYWATYAMTPGEALLAIFAQEVPEARLPLREGKRAYRFYRWPGGFPTIPDLQRLPRPLRWANGAQLIGYRVAGDLRPGGTLRWTLVWQPTRTPDEDLYYHWFNHLLDAQGTFRGQRDGPSVLPAYWRAGDTVLNWFEIAIPADAPPGNYRMRVGMYTYPALENVPLLDEAGRPAGEWAEIGPIPIGRGSAGR